MPSQISRRRKRTVFVVRGKLGDSLAAMLTVKNYAERHTEEDVCVQITAAYAPMFEGMPGVRLLPFNGLARMLFDMLCLRFSGGVDQLAVIWGFGKHMPTLARLSGAPVRVYRDRRYPEGVFTHIAPAEPNWFLSDYAWQIASVLDPHLPRPKAMEFNTLARHRQGEGDYIALASVAAEMRKCMDRATLDTLIDTTRSRFPDLPLKLLGNPHDKPLAALLAAPLPIGVEFQPFTDLPSLISALV